MYDRSRFSAVMTSKSFTGFSLAPFVPNVRVGYTDEKCIYIDYDTIRSVEKTDELVVLKAANMVLNIPPKYTVCLKYPLLDRVTAFLVLKHYSNQDLNLTVRRFNLCASRHIQVNDPTSVVPFLATRKEQELMSNLMHANITGRPSKMSLKSSDDDYFAKIRLRDTNVKGTIGQMHFAGFKPSAWACGPIAIYAALWSHWVNIGLWSTKDLDSIVMNGLWWARLAKGPAMGLQDMVSQITRLCPEMYYTVKDVHDQKDLIESLGAKTRRFFQTVASPGAPSGHHTFVIYEGGVVSWFEPLAPALIKFASKSEWYQHLQRYSKMNMSMVEIRVSGWNSELYRKHMPPLPQVITRRKLLRKMTSYPYVIQLHEGSWKAFHIIDEDVAQVKLPQPLPDMIYMVSMPTFSVMAGTDLLKTTTILLGKAEKVDSAGHSYQGYNQSMCHEPSSWQSTTGIESLVGHGGRWILPYIKRRKEPNCKVYVEDGRMYLVAMKHIDAQTDLTIARDVPKGKDAHVG